VRHKTTHRLRFNDTDQQGHINNAVFMVMLEQGRAEFLVELGIPLRTEAYAMVIVRVELDFLAEMSGTSSIRLHQALYQHGVSTGRAVSVVVALDRRTKRAMPLSPEWRSMLQPWIEAA
jgi:acyl-CoA thioester hydrolase